MRGNRRGNKKIMAFQKMARFDKKFIKGLYISVATLFVLFLCVIAFFHINKAIEYKHFLEEIDETLARDASLSTSSEDNKDEQQEKKQTDTTFTLTAIGDVMCHNTQFMDAYQKDTDSYDFSYVFEDINRYLKTADLVVGSLETSFAGKDKGYSNYPKFNSPDQLAYDLKKLGVNVLSTAGNHCLDMGFDGLSRTIDVLNDADISHVGTYKTPEDRDTILFRYVKGVKIAFVNYTYGTNGIAIPDGKGYCVNLIDKELMKKDIDSAKSQGADLVVACMHWGTEYETTANKEQEEFADFLFQNGVDVILGNHPHVLQSMEKRTVTLEDGTKKDGFVIYALGNFICDQNADNTRNSIILNLKITKHVDGNISIDEARYIPIYMYKDNSSKTRKMKLLDIKKSIESYDKSILNGVSPSFSKSLYDNLKVQLDKIKSIVGPEF